MKKNFSGHADQLSERERLRLLRVFDEVVPRIPPRPVSEVRREIEGIRRARRAQEEAPKAKVGMD